MALLTWVGIGFGLYSAHSFFPVYMAQSQLEGAIQNVLDHGTHNLSDGVLRSKALVALKSMSVPVSEEEIRIRRESGEGERTIHVEFDLPVTVTYLGSERELTWQVHAVRSFKVNEAAEARLIAKQKEERRHNEAISAREKSDHLAYVRRAQDKCNKGNNTGHLYITHTSGETQIVDCSNVTRW